VRTEPDQLQCFRIGFAIDQNQVWAEVAVAMIVPIARKGVVAKAIWKGKISDEECGGFGEEERQGIAVHSS
jgi:hypothetical protein